ncbi:hypothetical protein D2Q93_16490 [Alicyclobacillaceae bacterium I2511]|nr:hypothetical protein D2Q93_16490 [Alicyclobacillaceae bacterium I2511]
MWEEKLQEQGINPASLTKPTVKGKHLGGSNLIHEIEAVEGGNAAWYQSLRHVVEDPSIHRIIDQIDRDEAQHANVGQLLQPSTGAVSNRLQRIWRGERHRHGSSDWVGDSIYGVNDGLGAIFGIISGVAGYTLNTHTVLVSGFFGALASTLSMGAGAWLATRSENEVRDTAMSQEQTEIQEDPEHEVEELVLLYQLKGFNAEESARIAQQIAMDKNQFLRTMVQEEFGFQVSSQGNPWRAALFGSGSTLVGGLIPLLPFFFTTGWTALILAAIVSILAHFAVGAAKSVITVRGWLVSGLEMTAVGVIVGVVSYGLGWLASALFGSMAF